MILAVGFHPSYILCGMIVFSPPSGVSALNYQDARDTLIHHFFSELGRKYGHLQLKKVHHLSNWGDTLRINRRTKRIVAISDESQLLRVSFSRLVPIDSIIIAARELPKTKLAEGPLIILPLSVPNDPDYSDTNDYGFGRQWGLDSIKADRIWEFTTGKDLLLGINDGWGSYALHTELKGKFVNDTAFAADYWGWHGAMVSGIAGARTNNDTGVASLNWNVRLHRGEASDYDQISAAVTAGVDVLNFSWAVPAGGEDFYILRSKIRNAIAQGVVCVAGAGNSTTQPWSPYPAAFNFGDTGQVIAVSGTAVIRHPGPTDPFREHFAYTYNFSPTNDPFIDVAAPACTVRVLSPYNAVDYSYWDGTSFATALTSSLVTTLLSVNSNLTVQEIYEIITKSADKIRPNNQSNYDYDQNGWSRFMGYGRINAYRAVKYLLEHFGGLIDGNLEIPADEVWTFEPGVTVTLTSGSQITVLGRLNAVGSANAPITFQCSDPSEYWGPLIFSGSSVDSSILDNAIIKRCSEIQYLNNGGDVTTIQNSVLENCWSGIYLYESQPYILGNEIRNSMDNGIYGQATGLTPFVYDNKITKDSSHETYHQGLGIYLIDGVYALVAHNDISGFDNGMYFASDACVWFDKEASAPFSVNNRVRNTNNGIALGWGGTLAGGADSVTGRNSIYNNTYSDVNAFGNSWLMANWNYWGSDSAGVATCDSTSSIEVDYPLFTDPWQGSSRPAVLPGDIIKAALLKEGQGRKESIRTGRALEKAGRINEAIAHYKNMAKNGIAGEYALTALSKLVTKYGREDVLSYLTAFPGTASNSGMASHARKLLGGLAVQRGDYPAAAGYFDEITATSSSSYAVIGAKFDKFFAALHGKRDRNIASTILAELKAMDIEENEQVMRLATAERMLNGTRNMHRAAAKDKGTAGENGKPGEYELYQNYPNPFNPVTSISFALPKDGIATLKVYDILGKEIRTLVNEEKAAGRYTVSFNASSLPSGTYFYELRAGEFRSVKKMLILK